MKGYIVRRVLAMVPVVLAVAIFVFGLTHFVPGDPAALMAGGIKASPEQIEAIRVQLGLDRPIMVQLVDWLWSTARGDLGLSFFGKESVTTLIMSRVARTLWLGGLSMTFAIAFGFPLGVLAAWKANTWIDRVVMVYSTLGFSIPLFFLGFIFMLVFAVHLGWLPANGYISPREDLLQFVRHLIMPSIATGLVIMSLFTRMTRATVRETLNQDYIRTAREKGVREEFVLIRHALRNALLPVVTVVGASMAILLGGVVVTEQVFTIPGMGRLMVNAVQNRDFPLIQGIILLSALFHALINLLTDLTYAYLDPRIRY